MNQILLPLTLAIVSVIAIALFSIMDKLDFMKEDIKAIKKKLEDES